MTDSKAADAGSKSYKSGVRTWSLVISILILLPGAYAFLYFTERDDYLTNRYFRSLSEVDRQINQGITGLDSLLEFALAPEIAPEICAKEPEECEKYDIFLKQFSEQFAHVKFGNKGKCPKASKSSRELFDDKTYFEVNGVLDNRKVITYECPAPKRYISASVSISELIDPTPALQYFDQVLLLDAQGEVIYRSGKDDLAATENVSARDDYARFENLSHYLKNEVTHNVNLEKATVDSKSAPREVSHSTIREATIGKIDYLLFIQPFHPVRDQTLRGKATEASQSSAKTPVGNQVDRLAYLVGIVPYEQYFLNIVSLPVWKISNLLLAFLFLLVLVPHLKLYFSSRYFMPSRVFAWWIGVTYPLLTVLIWDAWCTWDLHLELQNSMDQEATMLSADLKDRYKREIGKVLEQKKAIESRVAKDQYKREIRKVMEKNKIIGSRSKEEKKCGGRDSDGAIYPIYGVAFFVDSKGNNTGCIQNNRTVGLRTDTSVKKRQYFSIPAYHPENLFSWDSDPKQSPSEPTPYYTERIQSYDHGLKLTALSFPIDGTTCTEEISDKQTNKGGPCLSVFIKMMQTFFAPVLPYDFGFAVIDDHTGDVYYHSNDQRSLLENFYIETDRNAQLISAVQSRHSQFVSGIYNAQPHRYYVAPLEGVPWSLIVFYDLSSIEIANLRSLLVSLIFSAVFILLVVAMLVVTRLIFPVRIFKPLKTLLPNGKVVSRLRSTFEKIEVRGIVDNSFDVVYVGLAMVFIFFVFGMIAWLTFSDVKESEIARMQRLNLVHTGRAILKRMNRLTLEEQRLGIKQHDNNSKTDGDDPDDCDSKKPITYGDDKDSSALGPLSDFAIYYPRGFEVNKAWSNDKICEPASQNDGGSESTNQDEDQPYLKFIEQGDTSLPVFSRFDANYLQMHYLKASDNSWCFVASDQVLPFLYIRNGAGEKYLSICSDHPVPHIHAMPESKQEMAYKACADTKQPTDREKLQCKEAPGVQPKPIDHGKQHDHAGSLLLALFFGLILLYQLGHLTATRLMGLYLPDPEKWADDQLTFLQEAPVKALCDNDENDASLVRDNLTVIANGDSYEHRELRAILYSRASDRIINTFNVTPVMWLILSGILVNENGLEFRDPRMQRWIQQQPWRQETREFLDSHGSDLWRILAPSFYVLILLAFVLITMSGGKIGDFLIGIIPLIFAGGIPALTNMIRERLK